jgi:predicted Rossmann fold flavoprotein
MSESPCTCDVLVLGAGAAGLMCAAVAGQRGRRVIVLEHNPQPGRKILISGGGRCNFTNLHCAPDRFLSANPHFAKSALALYQPAHFIELVNRYRIPWHEKTLGQLFCDHSSRAILDMLLAECECARAELILNARNMQVQRDSSGCFRIDSSAGQFSAAALVVATGGLSIPKLGATSSAYDLARQFGLRVVEPRPALVPLVLAGEEAHWASLAGVSADVVAWSESPGEKPSALSIGRPHRPMRGKATPSFREKMLFTHRGLSGPAILQASSYWRPGASIIVDFAPALPPGRRLFDSLHQPQSRRDISAFRTALRAALPQRLADRLSAVAPPQAWTNAALAAAEHRLRHFEFHPVGTEGFEKAEVTAGGIDTADLSARTLEARNVSGLFFIGEAVDVTGHLGGFNFQWAWSSAVAAGRAL